MLTFFKILAMIWPFVREMFFGNKNLRQILKENKFRVVVLVILVSSMGLNYFLSHRVVLISRDYLELKEKYQALEGAKKVPVAQGQEVKQKVEKASPPEKRDVPTSPEHVEKPHAVKKPQKKPVPPKPASSATRYQQLQESLEAIKEREAREEEEFHSTREEPYP